MKVTFPASDSSEPLTSDQVWQHLKDNVQGEATILTDEALVGITDLAKVRKYYKLNGLNWLESSKDEKFQRQELESLAIGAMALRGI